MLKAIGKAFKQPADYQSQLKAIDISSIDTLQYNTCLLQILSLYRAVANNSIKAEANNVSAIRQALKSNMAAALGKQLASDKTEIVAYSRTTILENSTYKTDACGYTPQYAIIVSIEQADRPLQPNICSKLFHDIVELMAE